MPPEIVVEKLRAAVHFPLAEHLKGFAIQHEDAPRSFAIRSAQRAHVYAFRSAMNRVRPRIARAAKYFLRLNDFHNRWFPRIWFCVHHVNPRRTQPRRSEEHTSELQSRFGIS